VQVITIDESCFESYRASADFIQRYIFPGGMLPTPALLARHAVSAGLSQGAVDRHAAHYARTLACWDEAVQARRAAIASLGFDERFLRMWRYYLAYCQAGFRTGRVDLVQTVFERPRD
jgi:cyclopropane-fatty-acyl-phospholipid synthase